MRSAVVQMRQIEQVSGNSEPNWIRSAIFGCGDCMFLILVSMTATLVMHLVHMSGWRLVFVLLVGMVIAMAIQTVLAMAVAPVLGSIESMVPSMVVAMVIPMLVCLLDLMRIGLSERGSLSLGAAGGIGVFLLIKAYGRRCRNSLRCAFPPKRG